MNAHRTLRLAFERHWWLTAGLLIALGGLVFGQGVNNLLSAYLGAHTVSYGSAPGGELVASTSELDPEHCYLCDLFPTPVDPPGPPEGPTIVHGPVVPPEPIPPGCYSDLGLRLVGTMIEVEHGGHTVAVLRHEGGMNVQVMSWGDSIGDARLVTIERGLVLFDDGEREHCLQTNREATPWPDGGLASSEPVETRPAEVEPVDARPDPPAAAIRNTGPRRYEIDRAAVRRMTRGLGPDDLPGYRQAYNEHGPAGVTLNGIERQQLAYQLGLRNGDTLVRVGETRVTTAQGLLDFNEAFLERDSVTVEVIRRGRPVELSYQAI